MQDLAAPVIMAIDDEPAVLAEVAAALGKPHYMCRTCSDPRQAMSMAKEIMPDLIVSDINIGGESGLELCARMKCEPELACVPVVFLSGAEIPDVIRRAHAAGGSYYLRKPFDPGVLQDLVDKALWMPHLMQAQAAK